MVMFLIQTSFFERMPNTDISLMSNADISLVQTYL